MSAALKAQLRALADARAEKATLDDQVKALKAAFDAEHADLFARQKAHGSAVDTLERDVRALAVASFSATGDKKPVPNVEIVMSSTLSYDEKAAFAWAQKTGMALVPQSLDTKAFENIAKATPLDFVTYQQTPSVRIATQINAAALVDATPVAVAAAASVEAPF